MSNGLSRSSTLVLVIATFLVAEMTILGGYGLGLLTAGIVVAACAMSREEMRGVALLISISIHLVGIAIFWTAIPWLRDFPILGGLLTESLRTEDVFSALPYDGGAIALTRFGSLLVLLTIPLIVIVGSRWLLPSRRRGAGDFLLPLGIASLTLAPLVVIKLARPAHLLAAFMSGDSRNHFLIVQQTRATLSTANFFSLSDLASPRFPHSISSLISAANGTTGINQVGDQWAVVSLVMISLVIFAFAVGVVLQIVLAKHVKTTRDSRLVKIGIAVPVSLVPLTSYVVYPILADGFVTLTFGIACLAVVVTVSALYSGASLTFSGVVYQIAGLYLVAISYPFLVVAGLGAIVGSFVRPILGWWRQDRLATFAGCALFVVFAGYGGRLLYPQFATSAALVGSFIPRNLSVAVCCLMVSLIAIVWRRSDIGIVLVGLFAGGYLSVFLIERVPGNELVGYSYYSTKVILAVALISLLFLPPILISLVVHQTREFEKSMVRRKSAVALAAGLIGIVPLSLARVADPTTSVQRLVWQGWSNPSPDSASVAIDEWSNTEPTAFFRFNNSDAGWLTHEDRMMNFWMPAFWSGFEGEFTGLWNWVYLTQNSPDTQIACAAIQGGITQLITKDSMLRMDINSECPELGKSVSITVQAS